MELQIETSDRVHARMLDEAPVLKDGKPYGVVEFCGDVDENPLCRRTAQLISKVIAPPVKTLEIGSGGGRWTRFLHPLSSQMLCVDGSPATVRHILGLGLSPSPRFTICPDGVLAGEKFDFVFSYDTFVHFGESLFWEYLKSIRRSVSPGGAVILHHGSHENKLPGQPTDHSGCWHCYSSRDVDSFFAEGGMAKTDELFADAGFGSRVVCYKLGDS